MPVSGGAADKLGNRYETFPSVRQDMLRAMEASIVGSPIPQDAVTKMSDEQWLRAMGGDPCEAGVNSTRGAVAGAIAKLLFNQHDQFERLQNAVHSLANDRSIAVRCCAIEALLAVLNIDVDKAISWFFDCISVDPVVLGTPYVERFVYFAGYRDFAAISPAINSMLDSTSPETIEAGARQVCLLAFEIEAAEPVAQRVRSGTPTMRKEAAKVYSANVAHDIVGPACRRMLKPFFADSDDAVRAEAASAFRHLAELPTTDQAELLSAFLDAAPGRSALEPLVWALEESPVQLPDLVCSFAERCFDAYRAEAGDISKAGAGISMYLSKIVVRLYAQTEDRAIQSRCLNLIDEMEKYHFMGLSDELRRLDR